MSQISHRILDSQGAGLIIDYGFLSDEKVTGENKGKLDTFRGYRKHHQVDVLEFPGETDLTADVDFDFLAKALLYDNKLVEGVRLAGPITQRTWLKNMGIPLTFYPFLSTVAFLILTSLVIRPGSCSTYK